MNDVHLQHTLQFLRPLGTKSATQVTYEAPLSWKVLSAIWVLFCVPTRGFVQFKQHHFLRSIFSASGFPSKSRQKPLKPSSISMPPSQMWKPSRTWSRTLVFSPTNLLRLATLFYVKLISWPKGNFSSPRTPCHRIFSPAFPPRKRYNQLLMLTISDSCTSALLRKPRSPQSFLEVFEMTRPSSKQNALPKNS